MRRHEAQNFIQPVCHSLQERGEEYQNKWGCHRKDSRLCLGGDPHGQERQEKVADVAGYESQHPSLPQIKIIDTFPELPLDSAACALEAEIAQGEQAINKHGSPVQDCYQQKTCLDLGRGSFIPATKGGKIHRIRFPFEFVREDASQQKTQNQNSQRRNISGVFQQLMPAFVVCDVEGYL